MRTKNQKYRRSLLKAIAGAGGIYTAGRVLPETWTRPVVDVVSLPAHAQTSGVYYGVVDLSSLIGSASPEGGGILDLIVPAAHAQVASEAHICITPSGDQAQLDLVLLNFISPPGTGVQFGGMVPIGGAATALDFVSAGTDCIIKIGSWSARIDSLAKGTIFEFGSPLFDFDIPIQACNLPGLGVCKTD